MAAYNQKYMDEDKSDPQNLMWILKRRRI